MKKLIAFVLNIGLYVVLSRLWQSTGHFRKNKDKLIYDQLQEPSNAEGTAIFQNPAEFRQIYEGVAG